MIAKRYQISFYQELMRRDFMSSAESSCKEFAVLQKVPSHCILQKYKNLIFEIIYVQEQGHILPSIYAIP